jgi:hypothetical protein
METYVTIAGEGLQNLGLLLGAQGLSAGRDLCRATPAVTWDLGFVRSHPKDRPHLVAFCDTQGDVEDLL